MFSSVCVLSFSGITVSGLLFCLKALPDWVLTLYHLIPLSDWIVATVSSSESHTLSPVCNVLKGQALCLNQNLVSVSFKGYFFILET